MRIIARKTLLDYVQGRERQADQGALKSALDAWFAEVSQASWANSAELKAQFSSASILSSERVVFNIRGNRYRLVVAVDFDRGIVWIKWLGTHKDYDRIDVKVVQHGDG